MEDVVMTVFRFANRHPELVSGSIPPSATEVPAARWMLKQVQHDG